MFFFLNLLRYLKQELVAPEQARITSVSWHPEQPTKLIMTTSSKIMLSLEFGRELSLTTEYFFEYRFFWDVYVSHSEPPNDSGAMAVVDGSRCSFAHCFYVNFYRALLSASHVDTIPDAKCAPTNVVLRH